MSNILDRIAFFIAERQFRGAALESLIRPSAVCKADLETQWVSNLHDLKKIGGINMTYKLMKRIITKGGYDREATLLKLDVFLMADRITVEEYQELVELMGGGDE